MSSAETLRDLAEQESGKQFAPDSFSLVPLEAMDLESLELLEFFLAVEGEFSITLPQEEMHTFGDILKVLEAHGR